MPERELAQKRPTLLDDDIDGRVDDIDSRVQEIDGSLIEGLAADERLQSGVPEGQRTTDLDFVRMTGLTRPPQPGTPPEDPAESAGSVEPLSFYEDGVSDVDAAVAPRGLEDPAGSEDDTLPAAEGPREEAEASPAPEAADGLVAPVDELLLEEVPAAPEAEVPREPEVDPPALPPSTHVETEGILEELDEDEAAAWPPEEAGAPAAPGAETPAPDDLTGATPPEGVAFTEEPAMPPDSLAEAEQLLETLESQPREPVDDDAEWTDAGVPVPIPAALESEPAREADELAGPPHRNAPPRARRRSKGGRRRRHAVRWAIRLCSVAILAAAAVVAFAWLRPRMAGSEDVLAGAGALARQGRYLQASRAYADFVRRYPDHPSRAELQFLAAHCLQMAPTQSFDERQVNLERARELFRQFIDAHPAHAKTPRARVLMGQICAELGRHEDAIDLLRDPKLPLKDPDAALPALRLLGRSYAQLGDYEAAESAYLQAAALNGNYSPDLDFVALAELFRLRADRAQTPEDRERFLGAAIEQWAHAVRVPGIDPKSKERIERLMEHLAGSPPAAGAGESRVSTTPEASPDPGPMAGPSALPPAARSAPAAASPVGWRSPAPAVPAPDVEAGLGEAGPAGQHSGNGPQQEGAGGPDGQSEGDDDAPNT